MPRIAAAAASMLPHAVADKPLEPPRELSPVEAGFWRQIVGASPASRFDAGSVPVLTELCRAMGVAQMLAEQMAALGGRSLTGNGKAAAATRAMFLQLAASARDQTRVIVSLATKLRLCPQTNVRAITAERERREHPPGPRPWDAERRN